VLPLTLETSQRALDLYVENGMTRQRDFDRELAAVMLLENIPVIVTENVSDFAGIEGLPPLIPSSERISQRRADAACSFTLLRADARTLARVTGRGNPRP
jgi:hypothetical protein